MSSYQDRLYFPRAMYISRGVDSAHRPGSPQISNYTSQTVFAFINCQLHTEFDAENLDWANAFLSFPAFAEAGQVIPAKGPI